MIEALIICVLTHETTFWALVITALISYLVGSTLADAGTKKDRKALHR